MSWNSPNYVKRKSGGASPKTVISTVLGNLRVPVYEPIMNDGVLALTQSGDLLIAKSAEVPLIEIEEP